MSRRIVVIGGGEHARVVMEAVCAGRGTDALAGFVDPNPCDDTRERLGIVRLGDDAAIAAHPGLLGVLGFGALEGNARAAAVRRLDGHLAGWATVVHPAAFVSPSATLGLGTVVLARAVVQTGARIGAHCVINTGAIVEHDAMLEDQVLVAPGAILGGGVRIGAGAVIGLGATVRDHVAVGAAAMIGMGAAVVGDVAPGLRVTGVPAR